MASLFNVLIKPVPTTAREAVKAIIMRMLGPNSGAKAELLLDKGGIVFSDLIEQGANHLAAQLRDAGATVLVEMSSNTQNLFRVRLLSLGTQKIQVIKQVRDITGLGLKESKELVENLGVIKESIDKPTADKIRTMLEKAGATVEIKRIAGGLENDHIDDNKLYNVSGRVDLDNGEPAKGVLVRAYDKDLRNEQLLGEASTNPAGEYTIPYTPEQFRRAEKNSADLFLRVFNEVGTEIALKTEIEDQPDIYFNSPKQTEINLQLKTSALVTPSEFERLQALLNPTLDGTPLAELLSEDIKFLIQETEIAEFPDEFPATENSIHFIAQSANLAVETSIPAEAFYAWARLGTGIIEEQDQDTLDLNTLLDKSDKQLKNTLEKAIKGLIVPAWLTEQLDLILEQFDQQRDNIKQEEKETWVEHQAKGILVAENSGEPLDGYLIRAGVSEQDNELDLERSITNTQGEFVLTYRLPPESVISTQKLTLHIESPNGEALDKQEISVVVDQVQPVTVKVAVPVQPEPGEEIELKALPIEFPRNLNSFLKRNNLTNIAALRKVGDLNKLEDLPDTLRGSDELIQLQAHVDLSLLATNLEPEQQIEQSQFLINKGFTHFLAIADMPVERFVSVIGEGATVVSPLILHANAIYQGRLLDNLYLDLQASNKPEELERDPALSCKCEDCVSALSPGAYLTDLTGYVTSNVVNEDTNNPITLDFIVKNFHQPLSELPINCAATKTQVRQVRIACEVLYQSLSDNQLSDSIEKTKSYRANAYAALLNAVGTSAADLQRASSEEELESIANRVGISTDQVKQLQQQDIGFNHALAEQALEGLFGLPAFMDEANAKPLNPIRFLKNEQPLPLLYNWRMEHVREQWKQQDFPGNIPFGNTIPIIDPDIIGPDDFRNTEPGNSLVFSIWIARREWVDGQVSDFHVLVAADQKNPKVSLETAFGKMAVSTTIKDLIAQQELLTTHGKIVKGDAFDQWLEARHISAEALAELSKYASYVDADKEFNDEDWQTYISDVVNILVGAAKKAVYATWITEETANNIKLDLAVFWPSLTEPKEGEWSIILEQNRPLIDPEKVEPVDLPDGKFGEEALKLWQGRRDKINKKQKEYANDLKTKDALRINNILADVYGGAPATSLGNTWIEAIEKLDTDRKDFDVLEAGKAKQIISNDLLLSEPEFQSLASANSLLQDPEKQLSDSLLNELIIILASANKMKNLFADWIIEEESNGSLKYWQALKARLPKWRAGNRPNWQQALENANQTPLIEPDIISGEVLLEPVVGNFAFDTWRSRTKLIDTELQTIGAFIESNNNVSADDVIKPDAANKMLNAYLGISMEELLELDKQEAAGISIITRLLQLALARDAYLLLLEVTKRVIGNKKVLKTTRENIYAILVQVWKRKQFTQWRAEEKEKLSLSPEFFKNPKLRVTDIPPGSQKWRIDRRSQRAWHRTLKGRIEQQETLVASLNNIVSDVEEQTLPALRDALINIIDTSTNELPIKAEELTKQFLVGMQISGCQMTTRMSMALELLQMLVFSIRSGELKIADTELSIKPKIFEKEWKWMGSYATWKAAMGVFLYPEQILYPSLRREKTPLFRSIEESLRSNISSESICKKATAYSDYLKDLVSMKPLASCDARVRVSGEGVCGEKTGELNLLYFVFAKGGYTNQYYWSSMDQNRINNYTQTYWETISAPKNVRIHKIIGAASLPYTSGKDTNDIYVFFEAYEENSYEKKIIYVVFDSESNSFLADENTVNLPEKSYESSLLVQGARQPSILIKCKDMIYLSSVKGEEWTHTALKQKKDLNPFGTPIIYNGKNNNLPGAESQATRFISTSISLYSAQIIRGTEKRRRLLNLLVSNVGGEYYSIQFILDSVLGDEKYFYYLYYSASMYMNTNNDKNAPICNFVNGGPNDSINTSSHTIFQRGKRLWLAVVDFYNAGYIGYSGIGYLESFPGKSISFANPNPRFRAAYTILTYSTVEEKASVHAAYTGVFHIKENDSGTRVGLKEVATRLISLTGNPERAPEIISRDKMEDLTRLYYIKDFHIQNPEKNNHPSRKVISHGEHFNHLEEAYFFLPLQIALSLYKKQFYVEALLWFRSIFDYQLTGRNRRLTYILGKEAASVSSYGRAKNWVQDPLNPHDIYRTNKYTSFTIQSIIRCLLDYADSEFTFDTSESVARAKKLYETALELIQSELPASPVNKCQALIDGIALVVEDATLQPYYDYLKVRLGEFTRTDLLESTITEVVDALNSNQSEESRLAVALQKIGEGLGEKKPSFNVLDILARSQQKRIEIGREFLAGIDLGLNMGNLIPISLNTGLIFDSPTGNTTEVEDVEIEEFSKIEVDYTPNLSYEFCIPNNPTSRFLLLRTELNLFKIRNCMNIAGMQRELEPYAAPIDVESALPSMGAGGQINLAGITRIRPTLYRYPVLVDRAKQLASLAQQTEASFFSAIQSKGQEAYSIFKARQDVELSREGVKLQSLRVRESEGGVDLAELQLERTSILEETYSEWSSNTRLDLEDKLLAAYKAASDFQRAASALRYTTQSSQIVASMAESAPWVVVFRAIALGATIAEGIIDQLAITKQLDIQTLSLDISVELRNREYGLQLQLSTQDIEIGNQQIKLANDRVQITEQEKTIAEIQSEQASDTVTFLQEKFTNVELYEWMSGVLEGIFRYYLQQGASMSKLAEIQLAFERQEPLLGVIKSDYFELPNNDGSASGESESSSIDRRGLTGSARLLRDITKLDQYAFTTDQRKQQLSVSLSLAQLDPFAFQQFRQTGVLNFDTPSKLFDRRFPGQYLRLIKRVRTSVVALVPPVQGISATLTASGISRVVIGGDVFQTTVIRRDPESIAFTNPIGATGIFELNPNPEMLLPFEGNGLDTRWEFRLPKASNPMDFNTIADVLITIEYTALHNRTYQEQVQRELDTYTSFDRGFSFRQEFSDAWYDLHNPDLTDTPMQISFETRLADFPSNIKELSISHVLMYFVTDTDLPRAFEANLTFVSNGNTRGGIAAPIDGVISTRRNGTNWSSIKGEPEGTWQLQLPNVPAIKQLFADEKITDILLVLTCEGELPNY